MGGEWPLADVTNSKFQNFITTELSSIINNAQLDGAFIDHTGFKYPMVGEADIPEIPQSIKDNWTSGEAETLSKLKQKLGNDSIVLYNALHIDATDNNPASDMDIYRTLLPKADGIWFENFGCLASQPFTRSSPDYKRLMEALDFAQQNDKYVFFIINTDKYGLFEDVTLSKHQQISRYMLAFYLSFFRGEKNPLVYYNPIKGFTVFVSTAYFADWDLRIGKPVEAASEIATKVWMRRFEKAFVYWNNSESPYTVNLSQTMLTAEGKPVNSYTMLARSGMIFVTPDVLEPYNPSFETVWLWKPNSEYWGELDYNIKHDGKRSFRISGTSDNYVGLKQPHDFAANTTYTYSTWVKADNNQTTNLYALKAPKGTTVVSGGNFTEDEEGAYITTDLPKGTTDWQQITIKFKTGSQGRQGSLNAIVITPNPEAIVWFDETKVSSSVATPTGIPSPTATPASPGETGNVVITVKFTGVNSRPTNDASQTVKIWGESSDGSIVLATRASPLSVIFSVDNQGLYTGTLNLAEIQLGKHYRLVIKGPRHLGREFVDVVLGSGGLVLTRTGQELPPGDLNQDGLVDEKDVAIINDNLGSLVTNPAGDLNYNNYTEGADKALILQTLSVRRDPQ